MNNNNYAPRFGRITRAVLVSGVLLSNVLAAAAGAAESGPVPTPADLEVAETSSVSPTTPGVNYGRSFETNTWITYGDNLARVFNDGDATLVIEVIDRDGVITSERLETTTDVGNVRGVAINDDFILIKSLALAPSLAASGRVDRATGEVSSLGGYRADLEDSTMSTDGTLIAGSAFGDPFWLDTTDLANRTFLEDDNGTITYISDRPVINAAGTVAAVIAQADFGGEERYVVVYDTVDPEGPSDQMIGLPCAGEACEYEIGGVHVDGFFTNIYIGVFELEGGEGTDRVSASYILRSTNEQASVPVSAISANGRFLVGNSQVGDGPAPTKTKLVVYDTETDRQRTVSIGGLGEGQTVFPLSVSDDGLFVQYRAYVPCFNVCFATPSYLGWYELEPTAPVTNGSAADQVQRLYRAVFGRIPDEGGFEFWMDRYREGQPLLDLAAEFAVSDEFVDRFGAAPTDEALIDGLYQNVLGRPGEPNGVDFWLASRANGASVAFLLVSFADSAENIERTATREPITVTEGRILRLYRAVFGRAPDDEGMAFWVDEAEGGQTLEQIAARFMVSPEFESRFGVDPNGVNLVDSLYRNVLGRRGDQAGVDFWRGEVEGGMTIPALLIAFANSDENIVNTGTVR